MSAQADTLAHFDVIEVSATRIHASALGSRTENFSASDLENISTQHIGQFLSSKSTIFIKNYGGGSIATSSIRGGSAGHTTVLWNGLPLQSPMLGQLDFSLLPTTVFDQLQIQYGGNTALWGSGSIGGVIALSNIPQFDKGWQVGTETVLGSFGLWRQNAVLNYSHKRFQTKTIFSHQQSNNDFTYTINPDLPEKKQVHANMNQQSVQQIFNFKINSKQLLNYHLWLQKTFREIPPKTTQNRSEATQEDQFLRSALHWKYLGDSWQLNARLGFFREHLDYKDKLILLESNSYFTTGLGEVEFQKHLNNNHFFHIGFNSNYKTTHSAGYESVPEEWQSAIFGAYRYSFHPRWQTQLSLRQEWINKRYAPLVGTFSLEGQLFSGGFLKGKVSRNYRLPTFNDRYWLPGGNPDLEAEQGWSQEMSFIWNPKFFNKNFSYSITGFNRNIHNWILWSVVEGQSFWSANNIAEVWSRGLEQRINFNYNYKKINAKINIGYDFIKSTNEVALEIPKIEKGSQLMYTPQHKGFFQLELERKNWQFSYGHTLTGAITTQAEPLESYHIGQARIQTKINIKNTNSKIFFQADNLWNANYRIIERRPMPGRNFLFGIKLNFNHKNKNNAD